MLLTTLRRVRAAAIEALAAGLDTPLTWRDFANCRGADSDLFFPVQGQPTKKAKALCAACDVREPCLEYAMANGIHLGIWGGRVERERRKLRTTKRDHEAARAS